MEFVSAAEQFTLEGLGYPPTNDEIYKGFLDQIALLSSDEENQSKEQEGFVTLMTLHAAKGLEFESVFMVGMEEGVFPHARTANDPKEIEEERRLCYVGMTRAKSRLFLTSAESRRLYGTTQWNRPSRFLKDLAGIEGVKKITGYSDDTPDRYHDPDDTSYAQDDDQDSRRSAVSSSRPGVLSSAGAPGEANKTGYRLGAWVRHPVFGIGQVRQCSGSEKITIQFSSVGLKKLVVKYAKLEQA